MSDEAKCPFPAAAHHGHATAGAKGDRDGRPDPLNLSILHRIRRARTLDATTCWPGSAG